HAFGPPLADFLAAGRFRDRALLLARPGLPTGRITQDPALVTVSEEHESTNRIVLAVSARTGAIVVGSIAQDGWTAKDEAGRSIPAPLADGPFLALMVPAGSHRVTLEYRPPGLASGAAISAACAAVLLLAGGETLRRRVSGTGHRIPA